MPWAEITRPHYQRATRRYASDLTDDEWRLLAPLMPEPSLQGIINSESDSYRVHWVVCD
jgi:hypothetical protein